LHRTPFHQFHADHGARFVDFAGWEMPILYKSIHEEHHHVRTRAGLFDVSHMGRIKVSGRHARRFLERMLTRRISDMDEQACRYSMICNEAGGVLDDVIVYRFSDHWLLVVNASNREKVLGHLRHHAGDAALKIEDQTFDTAMIALQGPGVMEIVGNFSREIPSLKRYRFCQKNLLIMKLTISRTGYTGEDGIEIIMPGSMAGMALKLWMRGKPDDPDQALRPAGLGARDTLRMEAGMPLYGHELDEQTDPLSAGLDSAVSLDKPAPEGASDDEPFIGAAALRAIAQAGPRRRLVGLKLDGRRTPRQGMAVLAGDDRVGQVTSGCLSPTLGRPIAMAYVEADSAERVSAVEIGSGRVDAAVTQLPFYRRG
jgi:aminomethyltransferase